METMIDSDEWTGGDPQPSPDTFDDAAGDWLWARSRPSLSESQDIDVPAVKSAIERHKWTMLPDHGETESVHRIVAETYAELRWDRNTALRGKRRLC